MALFRMDVTNDRVTYLNINTFNKLHKLSHLANVTKAEVQNVTDNVDTYM